MKNLVLLLFIGCALQLPERNTSSNQPKKHSTKLKGCVTELVGDYGVKPTEAYEICERIYRR